MRRAHFPATTTRVAFGVQGADTEGGHSSTSLRTVGKVSTQETQTETVGYRLSPQQQLLALTGGTAAVQCGALIESGVDPEQLRAALVEVVSRHEILRTRFVSPPGVLGAQMVIGDEPALEWSVETEPAPDGARGLERVLARDAQRGFALDRGPLLRAAFHGGVDGPGLLLLTAAAMCADTASLLVVLDELCAHVRGEIGGEDPIQYADYAEWRHELLADAAEDAERGRAFWRDDAADRPAPPRILFGELSAAAGAAASAVPLDLSGVDGEQLRRAAVTAGVSVPQFLEAAWHALVARLAGASEILVAGWSDGRAQPDLAHAIGAYEQPAPIRSRIEDDTSFAEVLDQVRRARTTATRWQDCADADELSALTAGAGLGFAVYSPGRAPEPATSIVALGPVFAAVPLLLVARIADAELGGELRYAAGTISQEDAAEIARCYAIMLAGTVGDPSQPVGRLPIVDESERAELIAAATAGALATPPAPVHKQFEAQAARVPSSLALAADASGHTALSYAELDARANQLANHLIAAGLEPGARVGLCMERTSATIVALLAIMKTGGAYVPLNHEHPRARLAHQLRDADVRALVTESHLLERLPEFDGAVCVDRDAVAIASQPAASAGVASSASDLAYVMYTSGSTGTPKGVAVTHGNLANYSAAIAERLGIDRPDALRPLAFGVLTAISTDLGNTTIYAPLISGGAIHVITPEGSMDAQALAGELDGATLDVIKLAPSHLQALLASDDGAVLPARWLILGGEALTWELVARIRGLGPSCRILNHYGPTEATRTVPIGMPLAGAQLHVLDRHLQPLPAGVPGELCIGGAGVAAGYVGADTSGEARFVADPFAAEGGRLYRTGDRARRLGDGAVEFLGRIDDQVKIRGFRVEPAEIEVALLAHPAIRQAAVSPEQDDHGVLRLVAYLVASELPPLSELRAFLGESLPEYMIPSAFATLEALAFTPSGKLDRKALPALAAVQMQREAEYVAPRDPVEQEIAEIWSELLGVERVGVLDDFFALGGHSLLATQVIMRIRRLHGDVPLRALLAAPTVATLADAVRAASADT